MHFCKLLHKQDLHIEHKVVHKFCSTWPFVKWSSHYEAGMQLRRSRLFFFRIVSIWSLKDSLLSNSMPRYLQLATGGKQVSAKYIASALDFENISSLDFDPSTVSLN